MEKKKIKSITDKIKMINIFSSKVKKEEKEERPQEEINAATAIDIENQWLHFRLIFATLKNIEEEIEKETEVSE